MERTSAISRERQVGIIDASVDRKAQRKGPSERESLPLRFKQWGLWYKHRSSQGIATTRSLPFAQSTLLASQILARGFPFFLKWSPLPLVLLKLDARYSQACQR